MDSILAQSNVNWELLAIDDFSTDDSHSMLEEYAAKDKRIAVFSNTEKGIIPALRLAFMNSKGDYITRMDADDVMAKDKLRLMQQALVASGSGHLVTSFVEYFSDASVGNGYRAYADWLNQLTARHANFEDIYKECVIPSPSWMVHRADLVECGAFDTDRYPEDYDLCFRFYEKGLKVVGIPEILHFWRDHPTRSSRTSPDYADNRFLDLKVDYFCRLDRRENQNLVLWGAGKKGKAIARQLADRNILFRWICNQPSKWGHRISGVILESQDVLDTMTDLQVILAVASPNDQMDIKKQLQEFGINKSDAFFFC